LEEAVNKLLEIFEEDNGGLSGQRVAFFLWNFSLVVVWSYVSIKNGAMAALDPGILAGMAIMQGAKVGQKMVEEKMNQPKVTETTTEERVTEAKGSKPEVVVTTVEEKVSQPQIVNREGNGE
jgi:hypothetical protein